MLKPEEIKANYVKFRNTINKLFPERAEKLNKLYDSFDEENLYFAPAASQEHLHNSIPGGYIDHVLRVMEFSNKGYEHCKNLGFDLSGFTKEELMFAALNHDLGKLGFSGTNNEYYQVNDSEWHRKNQGKLYKKNVALPFVEIQDLSLFLLQQFNIEITWNEYLGIKVHDGLYVDSNKSYFMGFNPEAKFRNMLPFILHHADINAAQFEFFRWQKESGKMKLNDVSKRNSDEVEEENNFIKLPPQKSNIPNMDEFSELFKI